MAGRGPRPGLRSRRQVAFPLALSPSFAHFPASYPPEKGLAGPYLSQNVLACALVSQCP